MIIHGDSLEKLKDVADQSVDLLCTDPPYGYSFMGKAWDKTLPDIGIFKECFRVLKPGAFAFVMSAPRSDVCARMMLMLEDAGFNICYTPIYHTYASGFPKALNVHKKLTKDAETSKHELLEVLRASLHSTAPHGEDKHGTLVSSVLAALESGAQCEVLAKDRPSKEVQVSEGGNESGVEGWSDVSPSQRELCVCPLCALPVRVRINGENGWLCHGAQARDGSITWTLTDARGERASFQSQSAGQPTEQLEAICDQCRTQKVGALAGAYGGFNPKPAVEVVIVASKPRDCKTFSEQALKNGKGITWLDDCRVPTAEVMKETKYPAGRAMNPGGGKRNTPEVTITPHEGGRFPANLLVSDDVLNDGKERKSAGGESKKYGDGKSFGSTKGIYHHFQDTGSYSRYFDLDAWAKTLPFLIVPKAAKSEKNAGLDHLPKKEAKERNSFQGLPDLRMDHEQNRVASANHHPTVKPLKLISYLITLGSRPGDVVLDPFLGSGTTAVAAKMLNRECIGIEREEEYVKIAEARLNAVPEQLPLQEKK